MNLFFILIFGLVIGFVLGNLGNQTGQLKKYLKTKLKDLIDHNLALENGYSFMTEKISEVRGKEPNINPQGEDLENHVKSKYNQQEAKIIFASGLLRELKEKDYVDKEWERYGLKFYNENFVMKTKK